MGDEDITSVGSDGRYLSPKRELLPLREESYPEKKVKTEQGK